MIKEPGSRKRYETLIVELVLVVVLDFKSFSQCSCCFRIKPESCAGSSSKACREKQRRDRLNDKYFLAFSSIFYPFEFLIF